MKKTLWTCLLAALALTWSPGALSPTLDSTTEATFSEPEPDDISCEAQCVNDESPHFVACARPTFAECCAISERICKDSGGLLWAGCSNSQVGVLCSEI